MAARYDRVVKTLCAGCHCTCGVIAYVKDEKVVKVEGDPDFPQNEGFMCAKGLAITQMLYDPNRILYPMKRKGERGEGKWERISWDEALDIVAERLLEIREKYGPSSITWSWGDAAYHCSKVTKQAWLRAVGSNVRFHSDGHYCYHPMMIANNLTLGSAITSEVGPDYRNSKCILLWGGNPVASHPTRARDIMLAKKNNGAKLIVIDPRMHELGAKADLFLQIRPATDDALALGMLNIIINEELYDKEFVDKWTIGFDELKQRVQEYPVERVAEITWLPVEDIIKAARMYATIKPAALHNRLGVQLRYNNIQTMRAIACLPAITGNLDVKGGNVYHYYPPGFKSLGMLLNEIKLPDEDQGIDAQQYPLLTGSRSLALNPCHPPSVIHAILTGKPYPIRAVWALNNLVVAMEDTIEVIEALKKLDLLIGSDYYMTPTMELCDVLLPPCTYLEREEVEHLFYPNYIAARRKVIEPIAETRNERWMDFEIMKRMGLELPKEFKNEEEYHDYILKDMGITFAELKEKGIIHEPLTYRKYEQKGFNTPSGKIELKSSILEELGHDPLPHYKENPETPVSAPILAEAYPLILITGVRHVFYFNGANIQLPWLREIVPEPLLEIHPDTARQYGLKDGEMSWIETPRGKGRTKQRVKYTEALAPGVVHAPSHWFYPEKRGEEAYLEANINYVTCNDPPYDPISGAVPVRGLLCRIYSAEE